jgi:hypothetical protein
MARTKALEDHDAAQIAAGAGIAAKKEIGGSI